MIKIDPRYIQRARRCVTKEDLYPLVQNAIVLEHSTIPVYLTAMFSLRDDKNTEIERLIRSIVVQEMSHMTIAANLLVSIGGSPQINKEGFIPTYPGPLPMSIGGTDFDVPIMAFSKKLLKDIFMVIEEPENPIHISAEAVRDFATIGEFYEALKAKIIALGNGIFLNNPEKQVVSWFDPNNVFAITNVETASKAIDIIVVEGEGTSTDPFESPGNAAHYYKFSEIYHGKKIVQTNNGYTYSGAHIPFDPSGVYPMVANPDIDDYEVGSKVRILMEAYADIYSDMLNALHGSFNGAPGKINTAIALMYKLKSQANDLMSTQISNGVTAGPAYTYQTV